MSHLVLIDGHHLLYRAYWAIPRTLTTKAGQQVNIPFGVASMLLAILKIEEPTHLLFCFDEGDQTLRHQENETYKDGRAETPDDFYPQVPVVFDFLSRSGIPQISHPDYEADDYLCAYARKAEEQGMKVTIVTGDRDALQLASKKVRIAIPHKGYQQAEYLDDDAVLAKYGVRPNQIADYKGLTGDSSDNLPGVNGIGPKTAAQLLQAYDTLEGIYDHLDAISPSVRAKLEADKEQAFFCRRMATLMCDIPLKHTLDDLALQELPAGEMLTMFRDLEFTLLSRRVKEMMRAPYGQSIFDVSSVEEEPGGGGDSSQQLAMF